MKLNCDLGESYGAWTMGQDELVMPWIDMANVACGFHASDPVIMHKTVAMALEHGVEIGAHPSYHDLVGFGRRSIAHTPEEITALMLYQIGALEGICRAEGARLTYVKPHGALNNDMMKEPSLLRTVMASVANYRPDLALMIPVTLDHSAHRALASQIGVPLIFEAFADRAYDDRGQLVPRTQSGSVHHDPATIVAQALSFATNGGVRSMSGQWLDLPAESLCVHGDNEHALAAVKAIRDALQSAGQ